MEKVKYLKVPAWTINGRQIGSYSFGEMQTHINRIEGFRSDDFWRNAHKNGNASLAKAILRYIRNGLQPEADRDVDDCKRMDGGNARDQTPRQNTDEGDRLRKQIGARSDTRPIQPPVRPIHTEGVPTSQVIGNKPDGEDEISVVVCLANYSGNTLSLPTNIQGWLEPRDSRASFIAWLEKEPLFPDESEEQTLTSLPYKEKLWLDWDVWVLPQWEEDQLYPWTPGDGRNAEDFLDPYVTSVWGRQLFFLVRIRGHPNTEALKKAWKAKNDQKAAEAKAAKTKPAKAKSKRRKSSGRK